MSTTERAALRRTAPLLVRLHFYAGVLVGPFLLVAAVTGLLYTAVPQLDRLFYGDDLRVGSVGDAALPVSEQVAAAQSTMPDLELASVFLADDPAATTRVTFDDPALTDDRQRTVYVDPYTGDVAGELVTWSGYTPVTTTLDDLHRNLLLGDVGRLYSELAASWLWVVALGGLLLWLRRRRERDRVRRVLLPEQSARGRRRNLSWHGSMGTLMLVGLLFLSATGLTWSQYAGERFGTALEQLDATAPELDTALPGGTAVSTSIDDVDGVLETARTTGVDGPVQVSPPSDGGAWTVSQADETWPTRLDEVAVDATTGTITATAAFADRPLLSKLSSLGVSAHKGTLFGLVNQLALAALALGLICVIVWGYYAWWQRRPVRGGAVGRPPRRGAWREAPVWLLVVGVPAAVAIGWALPLLGITLLAFLVLDGLIGLRHRRAPEPDPEPSPAVADDPAEVLLR